MLCSSFRFAAAALALASVVNLASCSSSSDTAALADGSSKPSALPKPGDEFAAENGDKDACLRLGLFHLLLAGGEKDADASSKDYASAFSYLSKAAELGDVGARIHLASLYENGLGVKQDLILAARNYRIASDSGSPEGQAALASFWLRLGSNLEDAEALCRKAVSQKPEEAAFLVDLAMILYAEGKLEDGSKAFDAALAKAKGDKAVASMVSGFYSGRGAEFFSSGSFDAAVAEFKLAEKANPADPAPVEMLGRAFMAKGDLEKAGETFERLVSKFPEDPESYVARSSFLKRKGDASGAEADLRKAISLAPSDARLHAALGCLLLDYNKGDGGMAELSEALRLDPSNPEALMRRAIHYSDMGEFAAARVDLEKLCALDPSNAMAVLALANAFYGLHEFGKAVELSSKAVELEPDYPAAYVCRASARLALGDLPNAEADCTRAIELDPSALLAYATRGSIRVAKGREDEALADFDAALKIDPGYFPALDSKARLLLAKGKAHDALSLLLVPAASFDVETLLLRAHIRMLLGDFTASAADSSSAIKLNGDNPGAWLMKAFALSALGAKDAEACATRAIDLGERSPAVYLLRGRVRYSEGRLERAVSDFNAYLEAAPSDSLGYQLRGAAEARLGQRAEALADFKKVCELNPSSDEAKADLAEALLMNGDAAGSYALAERVLGSKAAEEPALKAVALYLKCVAGSVLGHDIKTDEAALNEALKGDFSPNWSTEAFELWLRDVALTPEVKGRLAYFTALVKSKTKAQEEVSK